MITLRSIREIGDNGLLSLAIGGEESANYTVNSRVYLEIGSPSVGDALTDEEIYTIREFDEYYRAKKKALAILAYADNNRRNFRHRSNILPVDLPEDIFDPAPDSFIAEFPGNGTMGMMGTCSEKIKIFPVRHLNDHSILRIG